MTSSCSGVLTTETSIRVENARPGLAIQIANARGLVIVYPLGVGRSWNAGGCCLPASGTGIDDVGYLNAVQKTVTVTVADGILNLRFTPSIDNAIVSGITLAKQ